MEKSCPKKTPFLTAGPGPVVVEDLDRALAGKPVVFETIHPITLLAARSTIEFYTWSDSECCLPKGSTAATLRDADLDLEVGDVLVFEEQCSPTTGIEADADPTHRQAVRLTKVDYTVDPHDATPVVEIEWHGGDALTFPLCVTALVIDASGVPSVKRISAALGNVVLADHGLTISGQALTPEVAPDSENYRPRLSDEVITCAVRYNHDGGKAEAASGMIVQNSREALPVVQLALDGTAWEPRQSLLGSNRFDRDFVVELERDGGTYLRFGDDIAGRQPAWRSKQRIAKGTGGKETSAQTRSQGSYSLREASSMCVNPFRPREVPAPSPWRKYASSPRRRFARSAAG